MLSESLHVYMLFLKDVTRSGSNVEMCFFTIFFSEIILTKCSPLSCSNVQYLKLGIYERVRKQKKKEAVSIHFCVIGLDQSQLRPYDASYIICAHITRRTTLLTTQ